MWFSVPIRTTPLATFLSARVSTFAAAITMASSAADSAIVTYADWLSPYIINITFIVTSIKWGRCGRIGGGVGVDILSQVHWGEHVLWGGLRWGVPRVPHMISWCWEGCLWWERGAAVMVGGKIKLPLALSQCQGVLDTMVLVLLVFNTATSAKGPHQTHHVNTAQKT